MAGRDDLDGLATGRRATRRKNVRARQARQIVGRTEWLDGLLVLVQSLVNPAGFGRLVDLWAYGLAGATGLSSDSA